MNRSSLKSRFLLSLVSTLFFLFLLEAGLRITGAVYLSRSIDAGNGSAASVDGTFTILCIGDSFTLGSRVPGNGTYPAQLSHIIRSGSDGKPVEVVNRGVCEYNTWQVLRFLPAWLDQYNPDIVVLLAGSANRFNPWGYDFDRKSLPVIGPILCLVRESRVVKLVRITFLNLKTRMLSLSGNGNGTSGVNRLFGIDGRESGGGRYHEAKRYLVEKMGIVDRIEHDLPSMAWRQFNRGDKSEARSTISQFISEYPSHTEALCNAGYFAFESGDAEQAELLYARARELAPTSEFVTAQVAFFYSNLAREHLVPGEYPAAIDYFFDAILFNPHDEYLYYAMAKAFELQSEYDAGKILSGFEELVVEDPLIAGNPKFSDHIELFKNKREWDDRVAAWLDRDLSEICRLCLVSGGGMVIMNYPVPYAIANSALRRAAGNFEQPFIDLERIFTREIVKTGRERLLFDDDHCTVDGHWIMAEKIYNILDAEGDLK